MEDKLDNTMTNALKEAKWLFDNKAALDAAFAAAASGRLEDAIALSNLLQKKVKD